MEYQSQLSGDDGAAVERLVRPYEPGDRDPFLTLYETVWERRKGRDWFDWRFRANPYRDAVKMVVAESDGELVGAEPLLPFRVRVGRETLDAYQPVDWIVHPDHRRNGLFTRMTEFLLDGYADDASLLFNFPNDALQSGLERFDWQVLGEVPMRYRIHSPHHLVSWYAESDSPVASSAFVVLTAATEGVLGLLDRTNTPPTSVTVERQQDVPVETVAELYASNPPERVHVPRDEAFLRWAFENPLWETTTYVASRNGDPVASVVTATEDLDGCLRTTLLDLQPMTGPDARPDAFDALLSTIVADNRDADVLKAPGCFDSGLLRRHGFLRQTTFPLSHTTSYPTHAVRPLDFDTAGATEQTDGRSDAMDDDVVDAERWLLLPVDLDIE